MSFKKIYGHEQKKEYFKKIIEGENLNHSYIFHGEDGIGKYLFALEVAKAVLCTANLDDSCGVCSSCLKFESLNHPDVKIVEKDGKSIKNEQAEEFQSYINIKPFESNKKIVIINEAHLLTERAQNRILKTIEEPPGYAIFIFVTSKIEELIPTVISRCQSEGFNKLKKGELENVLLDMNLENYKEIANISDGRVISEFIESSYVEYKSTIVDFVKAISSKQREKIILFSKYLIENKADGNSILNLLIMLIRDIIVYQETNRNDLLIFKYDIDLIEEISYKLEKKDILIIIEKVENTIGNISSNMNYDLSVDKLIFDIDRISCREEL